MSWADLVQTVTLVTVAITIALSARQSREAARQSALAHNALGQSAHQTMVGHGAAYLASMMTDEPELIAWFLATRGIPPAGDTANKRFMLMFLRMDAHEATYLAYLDGSLPPDVWAGWRRVIELDALTPEFRTVWSVVSDSYALRFVALLDAMVAACEPSAEIEPNAPDNR